MPLCFFGQALRVNKLFVYFIEVLFLTGGEIQDFVIFHSCFLKFTLITKIFSHLFKLLVSVNYNYRINFVRFLNDDIFVLQ